MSDGINAAVVGLGKLGSPLAAVLAASGISVRGFDRSPGTRAALSEGRAPVDEAGLQDALDSGRGHLAISETVDDAVTGADVVFVVVPTPSGPGDTFDISAVIEVVTDVGAVISGARNYPVVVITSTVNPGDTSGSIRAALERSSGRRCGVDFGIVYNPEFIALGSVIADMMSPDFLLIGSDDDRATQKVLDVYRRLYPVLPPAAVIAPVNAELAKLAINTFVTTKISFANMLYQLCERVAGGDVDQVTTAVGLDQRIGSKYLRGGLGFGGPCFPRDNRSLAAFASGIGIEAPIPVATDRMNALQAEHLVERLSELVGPLKEIAVLGLSYKPGTWVVEASASLDIASRIAAAGYGLRVHDPKAGEAARATLPDVAVIHESVSACVEGADAVVIATPWPEYRQLDVNLLRSGTVVLDPWRHLPDGFGRDRVLHVPGGRCIADADRARTAATEEVL